MPRAAVNRLFMAVAECANPGLFGDVGGQHDHRSGCISSGPHDQVFRTANGCRPRVSVYGECTIWPRCECVPTPPQLSDRLLPVGGRQAHRRPCSNNAESLASIRQLRCQDLNAPRLLLRRALTYFDLQEAIDVSGCLQSPGCSSASNRHMEQLFLDTLDIDANIVHVLALTHEGARRTDMARTSRHQGTAPTSEATDQTCGDSCAGS